MSQGSPQPAAQDARGMRFAIVAARWNAQVTDPMLAAARKALEERGAEVIVHRCAGAFEVAPLCARVARKGGLQGIVAIGCLIRGGTDHYRVLADETTRALGSLALEGALSPQPLAVAFGVLTCDTEEQAMERADPARGNKGREAALACLEQAHALREVGA